MLRRTTALVAMVLVLASCGGGDDDDTSSSRSGEPRSREQPGAPSPLDWSDCGDVECASLDVPLDYDDTAGPTIALTLERRRATGNRIGALLANPGGPGASGTTLVDDAPSYFSEELLSRFDIVAWDPRGVGESSPVDCVDDLDFFFAVDHSPDDAAEIDANISASRRLADACQERTGDILPYLSSRATVRDMDAIRAALGEEKLTYIGFSYGSLLGALYAEQYPDRVRALVLDGAVDPSLALEQTVLDQAMGFDSALAAFFGYCERSDCRFGGDNPRDAYERLAAQIEAETVPGEVGGEERELGPGEFDIGVATALYSGEDGWPVLADALRDAARGDGTAMLALADSYTARRPGAQYDNGFEAFLAIGCLDAPVPAIEDLAAVADRVAAEAPYFGAANTWLSAPCSVWPVPPEATPAPLTGAGAPPIVVIGTSNDPATPLKWAESLADQLESARLLVYEGEGHTAYARGDACVDEAVDSYLVDLDVLADGTRC